MCNQFAGIQDSRVMLKYNVHAIKINTIIHHKSSIQPLGGGGWGLIYFISCLMNMGVSYIGGWGLF